MENKEDLKQDILEAEQVCEELEAELWNRSRGIVEYYEKSSEEDLEDFLNSAQNHFNYLCSCWDSDYPEQNWYD